MTLTAIDILPQREAASNALPSPRCVNATNYRTRLHQRAITDLAIDRGKIRANEHGWLYPIAPDLDVLRWKAYDSSSSPKYRWEPAKPDNARFYNPRGDLAAHIAAAGGVLILATGEADVWACWSAGIFNVTCTLHGEGTVPPWLIPELHTLAVQTVLYFPDCDQTGLRAAAKLRTALHDSGIALAVYALPFAPDSKGDLNTLLIEVGSDGFRAALDSCEPLTLPDPEDRLKSEPSRQTDLPSDYSDLYERWCVEVVETAAIRVWEITPNKGNGWSRKNFSSPLREDRNPSARWSYTAHGFKDFATGEFYNTATCADLLGLPTWEQFKADHRPEIARHNACCRKPTGDEAIHYANGFPWTLTRFLLTAKDKTVDRLDLADLAVVELLHTLCTMPERVTVTDFVRLAAAQGWTVDPRVVTAGFTRGADMAIYKIEPIDSKGSQTIGSKLYNATFRFKSVAERLRALGEYLAPRMIAPRRAPATASEIAAVLGDTTGGLDALDSGRADLVAAADQALPEEQRRAQHERRAARWLEVWQSRILSNILAGTYQPLTLEPQALSAPKLRTAIARQLIGEGVEVRKVVGVTGLSKTTALKLAREMGLESVPQTATIPADQVTDTMHRRGLVIEESAGTATIHTPNVFKRIDSLTAEEQRQVREQQALQRGRARRRLSRPTTAQDAAQRRQEIRHHQADEQAARLVAGMLDHPVRRKKLRRDPLDAWLDYQWNLAPPLSSPPIDPETGEVLTGRARWQRAFETVRSNTMPTFTAHTEPNEPPAPEVERESAEPTVPPVVGDRPPLTAQRRRALGSDPLHQRDLSLWQLTGVSEETARAHGCECCGKPAAGQNFIGGWRCETHWKWADVSR